jgi:Tfp pilus assembly protein PilX
MNPERTPRPLSNQNGAVLVTAILIMSVLVLLGSTAVMTTSTDLKISGNWFYSFEEKYHPNNGYPQ